MIRREQILPPYTRRVDDLRHRIVQLVGIASVVLLAVLFGFVIALFGMYGWFIYAIPLVLLALLALWMAPDVDTDVDRLITKLYFLFAAVLLIWPSYIVLNLPGLPWISLQRISVFLLAGVALYAYSTSERLRHELGDILASHVLLSRLLLCWVVWHALMVVVGKMAAASRFADMLFMRYLFLLVTAWVVTRPGKAQQLLTLILVAAFITSAVVIPEYFNQQPIWIPHIPSFLSLSDEVLETLYHPVLRAGQYRAHSIFMEALSYAEYLGMLFPFCMLAIAWAKTPLHRTLAIALLVLMMTAGVLTQTRSAYLAIYSTVPAFLGIWIWRRYRLLAGKRDLVAPAMVSLYPAALLTLVMAALFVGRVRTRLLGDGTQDASNAARGDQWALALPKVMKNPFGYGVGTVRENVPYFLPGGKWTIDSYPINLLIEYGIPGFLLFFSFFLIIIAVGVKVYVGAVGRDEQVAGAAAVGLVSFLMTRLILSADGSLELAFGYAGIIFGLWFVQKQRLARQEQQPASSVSALPEDAAGHLREGNGDSHPERGWRRKEPV